jgi:hypothetical protein
MAVAPAFITAAVLHRRASWPLRWIAPFIVLIVVAPVIVEVVTS